MKTYLERSKRLLILVASEACWEQRLLAFMDYLLKWPLTDRGYVYIIY